MTIQDHPHPRVESLINTFSDWLKHRRELSEIRKMDRTEFDRIANDMKVSPADLDILVRRGPHAADELPKLLETLGIDEAALKRSQPLVLRDMERVCAMCSHKQRCDRDIDDGILAERYEAYCPNAPTIDLLNPPAADKVWHETK